MPEIPLLVPTYVADENPSLQSAHLGGIAIFPRWKPAVPPRTRDDGEFDGTTFRLVEFAEPISMKTVFASPTSAILLDRQARDQMDVPIVPR